MRSCVLLPSAVNDIGLCQFATRQLQPASLSPGRVRLAATLARPQCPNLPGLALNAARSFSVGGADVAGAKGIAGFREAFLAPKAKLFVLRLPLLVRGGGWLATAAAFTGTGTRARICLGAFVVLDLVVDADVEDVGFGRAEVAR